MHVGELNEPCMYERQKPIFGRTPEAFVPETRLVQLALVYTVFTARLGSLA